MLGKSEPTVSNEVNEYPNFLYELRYIVSIIKLCEIIRNASCDKVSTTICSLSTPYDVPENQDTPGCHSVRDGDRNGDDDQMPQRIMIVKEVENLLPVDGGALPALHTRRGAIEH